MDIFKILDEYEIKARYFPAIIATIPVWILTILFKTELQFLFFEKNYFVFKQMSISLVALILLINLERFVGKYYIEKFIFKDELEFPTTTILLKSDKTLSTEFKNKLYQKIKEDFSIDLSNCRKDVIENRRIIKDIVSQIRLKVGKGKLLLQYNIHYGFFRNLYGGLLLVIPVVFINPIFSYLKQNNVLFIFSVILLLITIILFACSKHILTLLAESYAKRLFDEYIYLEENKNLNRRE